MSMDIELLKREAALEAVKHVKSGMTVGLGTGSTAKHAIQEIGRLVQEHKLMDIVGVPTSLESERLARESGIEVVELSAAGVDLAIDGADEIDPSLELIKGAGGAILREKLVEFNARQFIVVADSSKLVMTLGERFPLPVEIVPWGHRATLVKLAEIRQQAQVRLRVRDGEPVKSDNGNLIADCRFGLIEDPRDFDARIRHVPGVIETGLFVGYANIAYVAGPNGVECFKR